MFDKIKKLMLDLLRWSAPTIKKKHLCSINFEINYDESINIYCNWPIFDTKNSQHISTVAKQYGTMLFMLNNGFMKEDIINTLIKFDDTGNEHDAKFVNVSLEKWLDLFNENTYNTPLIKPSSVFKNYK